MMRVKESDSILDLLCCQTGISIPKHSRLNFLSSNTGLGEETFPNLVFEERKFCLTRRVTVWISDYTHRFPRDAFMINDIVSR